MKKILIAIILVVASVSCMFAQTTEIQITPEKDHSVYFPKQGDFALGVDLGNFFKFLGNTVKDNSSSEDYDAVEAFQSDIFGKYFLKDNMALRFRLEALINNSTSRAFVDNDYDRLNDPFAETQTVDRRKQQMYHFELGAGIEFRRSLWRLQGYAGGEAFFGFTNTKLNFEYGNPYTNLNQDPSTTDFMDGSVIENKKGGGRVLETKDFSRFTYGLGAFVGVDYFINRNISIGVEFKFDGRFKYTPERNAVIEYWAIDELRTKEEPLMPHGTSFSLVPTTYFSLMFYF